MFRAKWDKVYLPEAVSILLTAGTVNCIQLNADQHTNETKGHAYTYELVACLLLGVK